MAGVIERGGGHFAYRVWALTLNVYEGTQNLPLLAVSGAFGTAFTEYLYCSK